MRLLEMNHIKKSFDGQEVLKDISIHVDEGEVLSIIGPSGSGKSTMLRCATMLETIDDGEIIYLGDAAAVSRDGHAVYAKAADLKKIHNYYGLVFQNFNLFPVHFKSSLRGQISGRLHHFAACGNVSSDINLAGSCVHDYGAFRYL